MIVRHCAGGVVFYANKVVLLRMIEENGLYQKEKYIKMN